MTNQVEQKRLQKALEIVRSDGVTANVEAKSYLVKSQTSDHSYIVNTLVTGRKCGCKDHQNGHICKHIIASELHQARKIAQVIKEKVQERTYSSTLVFQMNGVILRINGNNDLGQALRLDGNVTFLKALDHPHRREFGAWFDAMALLLQDKVETEPEPEPMKPTELVEHIDNFLAGLQARVERNKQGNPPMTAQEAMAELYG
jgi:hypothetical protein